MFQALLFEPVSVVYVFDNALPVRGKPLGHSNVTPRGVVHYIHNISPLTLKHNGSA